MASAFTTRAFTGFAFCNDVGLDVAQAVALAFTTWAFASFTAARAFAGFTGNDIACRADHGMALAFTARAFAGFAGERGGCCAGADSEDSGGHGDFVEVEHKFLLDKS